MKYLAKFDNYTLRRSANGNLYIGVYRKPHIGYSVGAFLNCDLGIPATTREKARLAVAFASRMAAVVKK